MNKIDRPVFVTGVERSGTSIIAKVIAIGGAFVGKVTEMQENEGIRKLVDDYYGKIKYPINGQFPLPDTNSLLIPGDWKDTIFSILKKQGYDDSQIWMYKNFRLCQIWPVWMQAFPSAKWVIVRRRTGDIIQSCAKTGFMTAFKDPIVQLFVGVDREIDGWKWWVHEHEKRFMEMIEEGINYKIVWPERMVSGDYTQEIELLEWLGLKWDDSIKDIIDPLLWYSKQKEKEVKSGSTCDSR
jgi:hypothetical protein